MGHRYQDLEPFKLALRISAESRTVVDTWSYFHRDTLGRQVVRAADSIPTNIAEGHGRYTFKERIRFCHFARGSLYGFETQLRIAHRRKLIASESHEVLSDPVSRLGQLLNGYIRHLTRLESSNSVAGRTRD